VRLGNEKIAVFSEAEVKIAIHGLLKVILSLFQIIKVPENQLLNLPLFLEKKFKHDEPLKVDIVICLPHHSANFAKVRLRRTSAQGLRHRAQGKNNKRKLIFSLCLAARADKSIELCPPQGGIVGWP
jgi:hypothetical protein